MKNLLYSFLFSLMLSTSANAAELQEICVSNITLMAGKFLDLCIAIEETNAVGRIKQEMIFEFNGDHNSLSTPVGQRHALKSFKKSAAVETAYITYFYIHPHISPKP